MSALDTGDGVTFHNFGGDSHPQMGKKQLAAMTEELGLKPGDLASGRVPDEYDLYMGTEGRWDTPGSGDATRGMLDDISERMPGTQNALDQNPAIPQRAAQKRAQDAALAKRFGAPRQDIQNAREIIENAGSDWRSALEKALKAGLVSLPAVSIMYNQMSEEDALPLLTGGGA